MTLSTKNLVLASLVLLAAVALRVSFSWTSLEYLPATSDEASSALLAKEIAQGARPLLFVGQPYQFPIESYLMAPLVHLMPRDAFGARYQSLVLGVMTTCAMLAAAWFLFPAGARWPACLLILLPSAYWLQHQSGYTPPQYAMTGFLTSLVFLFVILAHNFRQNRYFLLAGLMGGLLLSNHMLGISVVLGASTVLVLQVINTGKLQSLIVYLSGLVAGLVPYILAVMLIDGAYEGVTEILPRDMAWHQLEAFAMGKTIPGVFGINPVLFTDIYTNLNWGESVRLPFFFLFAAVLVFVFAQRVKTACSTISQRKLPDSHPADMFIIATILALVMFVFSSRAYPQGYRFLLEVVWCFPFLIAYAYQSSHRVIAKTIAVFAVIYALFNVAASADMINKWRENDGAVKEFAHTPDLQPLLEYLGSKDVEYCYASFWIAYRITFESDEHIVCAVPFNERFSGWSVPNKNRIDKKSDVPYVLMDTNRSELTPEFFEFDLAKSKFVSEQADVGKFRVFYDFSHPGFDFDQPLPRTSYSISTLENPDRDLQEMHDGDINTYWTSDNKQQKWMGLEVKLDVPSNIQRITLRYAEDAIKQPRMLWISTLKQGEWSHVKRSWHTLTKIDSENGNPVYGRYQNVIWFDTPMTIEAIRLKNAIPDYTINWSIAELELGTRNAASPEGSTKQERW